MQQSDARVPRFFVDEELASGSHLDIAGDAARHGATVLRLREGDPVTVFNGRGGEFSASVQAAGRKSLALRVLEHHAIERESPLRVDLLQGISSSDRMDLTVQKAVELGVASIRPVATRRSVVRLSEERAAARLAHWQRIVVSACEQCGRNRLPGVQAVQSLRESCEPRAEATQRFLLSPEATLRLRDAGIAEGDRIELAAGPEAGFSADEEELLIASGFVPVWLGPRILRTETAALAALAGLNALFGDA
jgi:16S rRNA (uracil1498-N3)-methyltransferase